jgi:competence protein ComEC
LLLALLMGDDRAQPPSMVAAFRASGLSHLSAVSGQNVAFLLAAAAPLLRRLAPAVRLGATLVLLAWFVVVTRIEPSVVRAAAMAAITAVALALGHRPSALRVLALCVAGVVLADPMLVHSVGFALSVAATAGLSVLAAPIARRLPGPRWLASLAAASIAAQVGVAPVQLAIFGPPPCTALAANVLAVPVASLVMLVGLPVTLVLGLVAPLVASVAPLAGPLAAPFALAGDLALFPLRIGVRWIWWVAEIGAAVSARAC